MLPPSLRYAEGNMAIVNFADNNYFLISLQKYETKNYETKKSLFIKEKITKIITTCFPD